MKGLLAIFGIGKDTSNLFAFNLLPPKTKEELEEEAKRARMLTYAILSPVICLGLTLVLFLVNVGYVDNTENGWKRSVDGIKQELSNPNNALGILKTRNGELKVKTDFIADPIAKNVDFELVFQVTDAVFAANPSSVVTSYGRQDTGEFLVNATSRNSTGPSQILQAFKEQSQVVAADLKLVQKPADSNDYRFTISFVMTNINLDDTNTAS